MKRYKIGDYLMHESAGVCQVKKIEMLALRGRGSDKEYYELEPVFQSGGQVITPVDDQNGRLRDIKTEDEMQSLLENVAKIDSLDTRNNREFQDTVKSIIADFDPKALASVVKTVYVRKKTRIESGKKAMSQDERFLQLAGKKLFDEMAFVLNQSHEVIEQSFFAKIDNAMQ